MTLSEKIVSLRTARKLSQQELAEVLEVSRQSVSKWETGQSIPDLDKIVRLADLFGVSVDELVREEERPQPPVPPQPQVVYLKEKHSLTRTQTVGVCVELVGLALDFLGLVGEGNLLILAGTALVILGLPLLLAKRHPWIILGFLAVALSWVVFNPYTSITPLGLWGGVRALITFLSFPEAQSPAYLMGIAIALGRGLLTAALLVLAWRAWRRRSDRGKVEEPGEE